MSQCPQQNVEEDWPLILAALTSHNRASRNSQAAAIGTIAIETASTFKPVAEAYYLLGTPGFKTWNDVEEWRRRNLRYYPGYGRGHIQLTWIDPNYINAGNYIGVDLKNNPDRAMEPEISAKVFGWYWCVARDIGPLADQWRWNSVREAVQGGLAHVDRLITICNTLLG